MMAASVAAAVPIAEPLPIQIVVAAVGCKVVPVGLPAFTPQQLIYDILGDYYDNDAQGDWDAEDANGNDHGADCR